MSSILSILSWVAVIVCINLSGGFYTTQTFAPAHLTVHVVDRTNGQKFFILAGVFMVACLFFLVRSCRLSVKTAHERSNGT